MTNLILDANNLLYRIFWVNKNKRSGDPSLSTLMFLRSIKSYADKFKPDVIYAVWDKKLKYPSTNFRKNLSTGDYKSNRDGNIAKEAHQNDGELKLLLDSLGIKSLYPNRMEADDVISWLVTEYQTAVTKNVIVSVDKDLYQLINNKTMVFNPIQKVAITEANFSNYTKGVMKENFLDYKSLIGDNSDNLKGLHKVGHKRALNLIEKYNKAGSWEKILTDDNLNIYKNNKQMMDLSVGWRYYEDEEIEYKKQTKQGLPNKNSSTFFDLCKKYELGTILKNKDKWISSFFANDVMQKVVDKVNLLNNKYINNRYEQQYQ